MSIAKHAA